MKLALPNVSGDVFVLSDTDLEAGLQGSRESPRKRIILPIHREQGDLVQRMLNFFQPGTYVVPHIHPNESASETVYVIQGKIGFIILEPDGTIRETHELAAGSLIDIVPNVWHSIVALEEDTVILETKRGPYDSTDKHFADWAPGEGEPGSDELVKTYEKRFSYPD